MGLADEYAWQDPRPHLSGEDAEKYLAGESNVRMPPQSGQSESEYIKFGQKHKLGTKPLVMPPENRSVGALTDDDLSALAESGTFPQALSGKVGRAPYHAPYQGGLVGGSDAEEQFNKIDTKFGREAFLHELRKNVIRRKEGEKGTAAIQEGFEDVGKALATEVAPRAVAYGIGNVAAPGIGGVAGLAAYEKALPWIKEQFGDAEAFFARVERLEETEQEVKSLRKELDALKSGRPDSPVTLEDSPDTGLKKGGATFKQNPDGSIDF